MAMIEEDHGCEITCNFCNERYHFSEEELRELGTIHRRPMRRKTELADPRGSAPQRVW